MSSEEWLQPFREGKPSKRSVGKMSQRGYLYCMRCIGPNYLKIGIAIRPDKRQKNLQQGCPYQLVIEKTWEVNNMRAAEKLAHQAMGDYNRGRHAGNEYKTEWFDMPTGGLKEVCKLVSGAISNHLVVTRVQAGATSKAGESSKTGGSSKTGKSGKSGKSKAYTWATQNGGNLNSILL